VSTDPSVYIVDDDPALRHSLSVLLAAKGCRVQSFASAREFLTAAPALPLGCLIVDIRMPEMDGLELMGRLRARGLEFPMVVITGHADVPLAVRAMKAGAVDFIEKPFAAEKLFGGIEAARSRFAVLTSELDPATAGAASRLTLLSPREREVLEGLLDGLPNKSIAYDLAISPRTVEIHRARVMDKMGARSLSELIRLALAAGVRPRRGPRGVSPI
jgi:two-component system, LuxR family, response regulator FixJ